MYPKIFPWKQSRNFEHPTNKQKLNFCGLPLDIDVHVSQFIFITIHIQ